MTYYELATLHTTIGAAPTLGPKIEAYVSAPEAKGRLLGAWASDIGQLNQIYVLRGFASLEELSAEQERVRADADPFGAIDHLTGLSLDRYKAFDFLPPVEPGEYGPYYEIRSYVMKVNGARPTYDRWKNAVPERVKHSKLVTAMHTLEGPLRFTHFWPYRSLDERAQIRGAAVASGIWPPKGGPDWLTTDMRSTIALPLPFSPLK